MKNRLFFLLFIISTVISVETTKNETEKKPEVEIEKLSQVEKCVKFVKPTDLVILDMDIWYKVGATVENSRSKDGVKIPYTLQLGDRKMPIAVENSIIGMCVNEQRKITVPPHHAYGHKTIKFQDGRILTGEATVIVEVKVIQILRTTEHEMQNFFQILDTDDNKEIDQEELQAVIELFEAAIDKDQFEREKMKSLLTASFKTFDKDGNGVISEDEFYNSTEDKRGFREEDVQVMKPLLKGMMERYAKHTQDNPPDAPCPTCPETIEDCPPVSCEDEDPSASSGCPAKTAENVKVVKPKIKYVKKRSKESKSNTEKKDRKKQEKHDPKDEL